MTDSPSTTSTEQDPQPYTHTEGGHIPNVHQAMANAMARVRAVGKWGQNTEQGYSFRSIDHFMTALSPAMAAAGVHIAPKVLRRITDDTHTTRSGNTIMRWVDVEMRFRFYGPAGDHFDVITWGEARDAADKATNKAMTGAFKYAIMQAFMVPTEDLDDADRHSPEADAPPAQQQQRQAPPPLAANADPATVDALRTELLGVVDDTHPGEARDLGLRALYAKAGKHEALGCTVAIPEAWRRGEATHVTLHELINGSRLITLPSGETQPAESADAGPQEPQGGPAGPDPTGAASSAVARARAAADREHAERSNERLEEDPWATQE
jgi:hypothetical protein